MLKLLKLGFSLFGQLYNYLWNLTALGTERQQLFLPTPLDIWWAYTQCSRSSTLIRGHIHFSETLPTSSHKFIFTMGI